MMSSSRRCSILPLLAVILVISLAGGSCSGRKRNSKRHETPVHGALNHHSNLPFDSSQVPAFYRAYPNLAKYRENVSEVYRKHRFTCIWYDTNGVVEFGQTLFGKVGELKDEGISSRFPYTGQINDIFENEKENKLTRAETDIMLTNLYLFYTDKVFKGLDDTTSTALGWLLPRKELSYSALLDSVIADKQLIDRNDSILYGQYYKLRDVLQRYREIEKKGGWKTIEVNPKIKSFKPGDTARTIRQIRERLFITGDLAQDSKSNRYDEDLVAAVKKYQRRNGFNPVDRILPEHIRQMNVPIAERIKKIIVNMERCRWISPEFAKSTEYIVVNIPSFRLTFVRNGKIELESPVIVGRNVNKTVIFSGMLSYIVFSPYWNVPTSIISKEIKPGMAKDKNYLEKHDMEWNNGQVRQRPGKNNSLGLVKFIFPNSNDIYMHDTPAKSLFARESRAFSHGCIRVGRPGDLAIAILKSDSLWTPGRVDAAMNAGKESSYVLKKKIPVYIGYLTAWVSAQGEINFYEDIYKRDEPLAELLMAGGTY